MSTTVNIARDFSKNPAGRFRTDGPYSGQEFRERFLLPALKSDSEVEVELDGVLGLGSSFLEEAFGGLVRECGIAASELKKKLRIHSRVRTYEERIWNYINEARPIKRFSY